MQTPEALDSLSPPSAGSRKKKEEGQPWPLLEVMRESLPDTEESPEG